MGAAGTRSSPALDRRQADADGYQQAGQCLRQTPTHLRRTIWLDQLKTRMHINKVVVALANKIAVIAWVIIIRPGRLYERVDPAYA